MKPNYTHPTLLSFLLFFTLKLFGQPGCDSPTLAQYCNQTCISCSGIDGYTNRLIMTEIGQPLPDFCTEWLLNQNYLGFMAGTTFLELEIEVFDCDKCCGMEAAIYKSTGCNQFTLVSDSCVTAIGFNKSYVFKNSVPFEEGGCYYLVFDSDGGSDCAFNINVLAGSTLPPNWTDSGVVTGPTEICAGLPATYHIPGLPCNRLHKWWLDGNEIASGQQAVELTFPAAGDYELCSQAFGICHEIPPTCITIHVPAVPTLEKPLECCAGDTITVDGLKFHTAGTFPHVYKTPLGCDSIVNYVVEILPVVTTNLSATICFGKTYPFLGDILTTAGLYQKILANPKTGCDSIVKLDLKIRPEAKSDLPMTICFGETFTLGGQTFSNSGKFPVVFQTAFGCDSTVTLDLKILPEAKSDLPKTLCFGETFTLGGQTFSTPGKFPVVFQTAFGCDSTVTLDLKILPEAKSDRAETICFGETFSLGGQTFSNSGNYQVKFLTPFGCDSTVNLTLKILPAAISSRTETICFGEKFTLGGQTFSNSGNYQVPFSTPFGCDSTVNLTLNVLAEKKSDLPATICAGKTFTLGGQLFSQTGNFPVIFPTPSGCDSTVTLKLIVLPPANSDLPKTICFGETFSLGGQTFSQTGNYPIIFQTTTGCDSTVTLKLKVLPEAKSDLPKTICFGQTFSLGGQTFSTPGKFPVVFQTPFGCDSTVTLDLKILPEAKSDLPKTICFGEKFTLGGQTFSVPGKYEVVFQTTFGCDSTVTLDLKILPEAKSDLAATICFGKNFTLGGQTFSQTGNFPVKLTAASGCDSIVTLKLTVRPEIKSDLSPTLCFGEKFTLGGQTFSQSGNFKVIFPAANGCDSTVNLHLKILPLPISDLGKTICFGETFSLGGKNFTTAGDYQIIFPAANGCDSLVQLKLKVIFCSIDFTMEIEPADCFGSADGVAKFEISKGNPPIDFELLENWKRPPLKNGTMPNSPTSLVLQPLPANDFQLILSDAEGLVDTIFFKITQPDSIWVNIGDDLEVRYGDEITVSPTSNFAIDMATWQPENLFDCPTCLPGETDSLLNSTKIWLIAKDESGCSVSDTLMVKVNKEHLIYVPNAFNPSSNLNDRVMIFANYFVKKVNTFQIYDRWGEQIFVEENFPPNDPHFGWTGKYRGKEMPTGVFVWFAEVELLDGELVLVKGDVSLVR